MSDAKPQYKGKNWYDLTNKEQRDWLFGDTSEDDNPTKTAEDKNKEFFTQKNTILKGYGKSGSCGGVYCITQKDTDRFYIGSSIDISSRIELHFLELEHGRHHNYKLQLDWSKYGKDSFTTEIVWEAPDHTDKNIILTVEQSYIDRDTPFYNIKKTVDYIKPKEKKFRVAKRTVKPAKVKKSNPKEQKRHQRREKQQNIFQKEILAEVRKDKYYTVRLCSQKYKFTRDGVDLLYDSYKGTFTSSLIKGSTFGVQGGNYDINTFKERFYKSLNNTYLFVKLYKP